MHIHGTPLSSLANTAKVLSGRHGLASFATAGGYVDVLAEVCQSFVLDNGAFSSWRSGEPVTDWSDCYRWYEKWLKHPGCDWALIPDVIDGGEKENDRLISEWPFGFRGVPIWHYHESLLRLELLCRAWPRVAIGSSGEWPIPGVAKWWRRTTDVMAMATDDNGYPLCKLHGLRMLNPEIFTRMPLASADSCNAGRNCGDVGNRLNLTADAAAEVIIRRIESQNGPSRWDASFIPTESFSLFGEVA